MTARSGKASIVCTMAYGHFHLGVAALANSLAANGFQGELLIGTDAASFPWLPPPDATGRFAIADGFHARIVPWTPPGNSLLSKARFLLQAMEEHAATAEDFFYMDADIVVAAPWWKYRAWVRSGVALCCDVSDPLMPATHPARLPWRRLAEESGYPVRPVTGYVNAGFVGVAAEHAPLLHCWDGFCAWFAGRYPDLDWRAAAVDPAFEWPGTDQDLLNAAVMCTEVPLSIAGPAAMGFAYGRTLMLHALGPRKPWKRAFLAEALRAWGPSRADKAFWRHCDGPLWPFRRPYLWLKRIDLALATALSRFYRR
jgi:hypothetical protein